ncbi:MAG: hypothetical protein ABW346_10485 [Terrimicrobium sp.]
MDVLNQLGLGAFKGVGDDDAFYGDGAFLAGLGILPPSGDKLSNDAREIMHLFHEVRVVFGPSATYQMIQPRLTLAAHLFVTACAHIL